MYEHNHCFVVIPYGKKPFGKTALDFDKLYNDLYVPLAKSLDLIIHRCKDLDQGGAIHLSMFDQLFNSGVVFADLTTANPNVMYELGVRHTLAKSMTFMFKHTKAKIPFNVDDHKIYEYSTLSDSQLADLKKTIALVMAKRTKPNYCDSPVLGRLTSLKIDSPEATMTTQKRRVYRLSEHAQDRIILVTGSIESIHDVSIWVNPENTNMLMARPMEQSISSTIRYLGAKRTTKGEITDDSVYNALMKKKGRKGSFDDGTVIETFSGELKRTQKVELIFHVAAAGIPRGQRIQPVADLPRCITNCLQLANCKKSKKLSSILFPLMGTGQARGDLAKIAPELFDAAIQFLNRNPDGTIDDVYFVARTEREYRVCKEVLDNRKDLAFVR